MPKPSRRFRPSIEAVVHQVDATLDGEPRPDTIATGFPSVDKLLGGGLRRRDLVLLAGDIGSGKSSLALGIALRSALAGTPVLFLSGEMSEERLMERALAIEGRAAVDELRTGKLDDQRRAEVGAAAVRLRSMPLVVRPLIGRSFDEIETAMKVVPRPALVVVDYLQLVPAPQETRDQEDALVLATRALKGLALAEDVAVLAVAQLPALMATREDPRPTLDDLGGRGQVKQHADVVLGLYREEMYRPGGGMEGATELIIGKNRNGPTGFVDLYFYRRWLRFEDMLDPER
ncbi:MAG TPA: DnaB-like helicase C-terminal domain-containing protein [Gemmatimonadales bacterium]